MMTNKKSGNNNKKNKSCTNSFCNDRNNSIAENKERAIAMIKKDPDYTRFIFACIIDLYLHGHMVKDQNMKLKFKQLLIELLHSGVSKKHLFDVDNESEKYVHYVESYDRGNINYLAHNTLPFYDRMKPRKSYAKVLEKINQCQKYQKSMRETDKKLNEIKENHTIQIKRIMKEQKEREKQIIKIKEKIRQIKELQDE